MISIRPFFENLDKLGITEAEFISYGIFSRGTFYKYKKNPDYVVIKTDTINLICNIMGLDLDGVIKYTPDTELIKQAKESV